MRKVANTTNKVRDYAKRMINSSGYEQSRIVSAVRNLRRCRVNLKIIKLEKYCKDVPALVS